jgi:hypothetical protein
MKNIFNRNQIKLIILQLFLGFMFSCDNENNIDEIIKQSIDSIKVTRVAYQESRHKAFTDITFFDNQFFLVFREADKHAYGEDGIIQIFNSMDGLQWNLIKEIIQPGIDLRDPKFAINGNQLSIYIHGSTYENQKIKSFSGYNLKYSETNGWQQPENVLLDNLATVTNKISGNEAWPWRITWHENKAYTVGYDGNEIFDIYKSDNGLFFKKQNVFSKVDKAPSEATIRVNSKGEFYVLVRRDKGPALLGKSKNPTEKWDWFSEIQIDNFRGPNFLLLDDDTILFSGSHYAYVYLGVFDLKTNTYKKVIDIPSFGDGSYPGMVVIDGILWLSYYTSFENKEGSSVYVAKINLKKLL